MLSLLLVSCLNYQQKEINTNKSINSNEIQQSGIQLGACQAGLTNTDAEYRLMDDLGVEWLRNVFAWSRLEPKPGVWNFEYYDKFMETAENYGKKVLIVLAYDVFWLYTEEEPKRNITPERRDAFLEYVKTVAKRYGSRAAGFEIWNEPNTPLFWKGSDEDFFELTRLTTALLKEIQPDKPVAVGSIFYHPIMSGKSYLKKMIRHGLLENADAVSLHPYGLSLSASAKRVVQADKLIKESGYDKEIWITEIGFTTGGSYPNKTSVPGQAVAVIHAITQLSAAGADLISWFKLLDGQMPEDVVKGISSEEFFGLAYPDYSLKPSGISYMPLAKTLAGTVFVPDDLNLDGISTGILQNFRYEGADGSTILIFWTKRGTIDVKITEFSGTVSVTNLITGDQKEISGTRSIKIGTDPVLIQGIPVNEDSVIGVHKIK